MSFVDSTKLCGDASFIFKSSQQVNINKNTKVRLEPGSIFRYEPTNNANSLLHFADSSSQLILNGARLDVSSSGIVFSKGMLRVKRSATLSSDEAGEGIALGDGTPDNDMKCVIEVGSTLNVVQGIVHYKNSKASSWFMTNSFSTLCMNSETILKLYESLPVSNGMVKFLDNTTLARVRGKTIEGSVEVLGKLDIIEIEPAV